MPHFARMLATSDNPTIRLARRARRAVLDFTLPAPKLIVRPALAVFLIFRWAYYFLLRVLVCEPLFKAYCTKYGRGLRTDVYIHWVQGRGDLILGDDVLVDGKCSFTFGSRLVDRPVLMVGDRTVISHDCRFTVARRVTIGSDCLIAAGVFILDSSGHPVDPAARLAHLPPPSDKIRPVEIGNNVWIGSYSIILPGVRVGDGSVVAAGSVVRANVPANTIVAGNPAKEIAALTPASSTGRIGGMASPESISRFDTRGAAPISASSTVNAAE